MVVIFNSHNSITSALILETLQEQGIKTTDVSNNCTTTNQLPDVFENV